MSILFFWRSRALRRILIQGAYVAALVAIVVSATLEARVNLAAQGLTSGFDFLAKTTGWEMNFTLLPSGPGDTYGRFLLLGLLNTLFMGAIGLTGATVIGLGILRTARNPAARLLGTIYVELFRNLPLIVQLFFWYALANSLPNPRQSIT